MTTSPAALARALRPPKIMGFAKKELAIINCYACGKAPIPVVLRALLRRTDAKERPADGPATTGPASTNNYTRDYTGEREEGGCRPADPTGDFAGGERAQSLETY